MTDAAQLTRALLAVVAALLAVTASVAPSGSAANDQPQTPTRTVAQQSPQVPTPPVEATAPTAEPVVPVAQTPTPAATTPSTTTPSTTTPSTTTPSTTTVPPVTGPTIAVAQDGSGAHQDIQSAVDAAKPGDTVLVSAGTYSGFTVTKDGAANSPITVRAAPGAKVIIDGGKGGESGAITLSGRSHIQLIGLTVRNASSFGIYGENAKNVTIHQCEIAGSGDGGMVFLSGAAISIFGATVHGTNAKGTSAAHEAVSFHNVDGFEIAGSKVFDNGEEGIDAKYGARNGKIHDNESRGNRGPNIYIDSASDIQVYKNQVLANTESSKAGIGLAVEDLSETRKLSNITIRDNTIRDNSGAGMNFWVESEGTFSGIVVEGNTFSSNAKGGIVLVGGTFSGENQFRNNTFGGGDKPPTSVPGVTLTNNSSGA